MNEAGLLVKLRQGALRAVALHTVSVLLLLAMHTRLAALLGPSGYGQFSHGMAVVVILAAFVTLGWPTALLRFIPAAVAANDWGQLNGLLRRAHQTTLAIALPVALGLWFGARLPSVPEELKISLGFAAILLPVVALAQVRRSALRGLHEVAGSMVPDDILLPLALLVGLTLGLIQDSNRAMSFYAMAAAITLLIGFGWLSWRRPPVARSVVARFETRAWMAVALPLVAASASQMALRRMPVVTLGALTSLEDVGVYALADRYAYIVTFLITSINVIAAPLMSTAFVNQGTAGVIRIVRRTAWWSVIGTLPAAAFMLVRPDLLLQLVGGSFEQAAEPLRILAGGFLICTCLGPVAPALVACGLERVLVRTVGVVTGLSVLALIFIVPRYGASGAAVVTAVGFVGMRGWQRWSLGRTR